jgi:hypothetical protein
MRRFVLALCAAATVAGAVISGGATETARAEESTYKELYTLDLSWEKPRRIRTGREPELDRSWYVLFSITNRDTKDHRFFLEVSAESEKGVTYRCNEQPLVLKAVRASLGLHEGEPLASCSALTIEHDETRQPPNFPTKLQLPLIKAGQTIRCVAIFHGWDPEANHLTVTWNGLTNDVQLAPTGQPNERKLSERVFRVEYYRGGDEFFPDEEWLEEVGHRWETLERVVKTDLE